MWYHGVDEADKSRQVWAIPVVSGKGMLSRDAVGRVGPGLVSQIKAVVNGGRGINNTLAPTSPSFLSKKIHPSTLLTFNYDCVYCVPKYFSMGGRNLWLHEWKSAGNWNSVPSRLLRASPRPGAHWTKLLMLSKRPVMTMVLTLTSGLTNIWNGPLAAPVGSLTLSTITNRLLPAVPAANPLTDISAPAGASVIPGRRIPASKSSVCARAEGFAVLLRYFAPLDNNNLSHYNQ